MAFFSALFGSALGVIRDILPVILLLVGFQLLVLRRAVPQWRRVVLGFVFVFIGLTIFLQGLQMALFPLGELMAKQLADPVFVFGGGAAPESPPWQAYGWLYAFAGLMGFSATIAEPSLIAVAHKANQVSRGTISELGLRVAVAVGVSLGITLGVFRIVTGTPLFAYVIAGYVVVVVQTALSSRMIIPLAYDSGGVTTSSVTVPVMTALGLGVSLAIPGRSPLLDGFGLIAFASVFPIMTVLGYGQFAQWRAHRLQQAAQKESS